MKISRTWSRKADASQMQKTTYKYTAAVCSSKESQSSQVFPSMVNNDSRQTFHKQICFWWWKTSPLLFPSFYMSYFPIDVLLKIANIKSDRQQDQIKITKWMKAILISGPWIQDNSKRQQSGATEIIGNKMRNEDQGWQIFWSKVVREA